MFKRYSAEWANPGVALFTELHGRQRLSLRVSHEIKFPLYKFSAKQWVDAFFQTGALRIGTLFDFHDVELHGRTRGDGLEGIFVHEKDGLNRATIAQNQWMFCVSRAFDPRCREAFGGDGYRIDEIGFFFELKRALPMKTTTPLLATVQYVDRSATAKSLPPTRFVGLVKDRANYGWQNEARIVWETDPPLPEDVWRRPEGAPDSEVDAEYRRYVQGEKRRVGPICITAPAARAFCTRL